MDRTAFAAEYPFASNYLEIDGLRYHYVDEGQGETLLLVHGNPTWSFYFRNVIKAFSSTHRVIAVDHIGCGLSDKPQAYPYCLATHIANLARLIDHLDLREMTVVVHDWGGAIGIGACSKKADRVRRLVILNTAAFRSRAIPWRIAVCRWPVIGPLAVRGFNLFSRASLSMAAVKTDRMTDAVRAGLLAPYDTWANRVAVYRFVRDIPLSPQHPSYATLRDVESSLAAFASTPVLIFWGMQDWCFTPAFLQRWLEYLPSARVERVTDAGHYVLEDAHELFVPALREFLNG